MHYEGDKEVSDGLYAALTSDGLLCNLLSLLSKVACLLLVTVFYTYVSI